MNIAGSRIRELRLRNHLTLDDVARHLGVGRQAIYKYEQGTVTNIPLENIQKMADLFGTTPEYLAGWTSDDEYRKRWAEYSNSHEPPDAPRTEETRILAKGVDKLPPEQREQALSVIRAMFAKYADYFDKENNE